MADTQDPNYEDLIKQQYQQDFSRDPTQNELSSDTANAQKYGWDSGPNGGVQATIDQRMTNTPNAGEHAPSTPTAQWNAVPVNYANQDPRAQSLYSTLLSRAGQNIIPTAQDPVIAAQTNAYGAQQTRGVRDFISQLAEKAGPYANLTGQQRMANENAAQNTSGFQAQLMGNELANRRQEVQSALTQMGGILSNDQSAMLQSELANIDAAMKQQSLNLQGQQIGNQQDQFLRQLALNQWQAQDNSNLNWAQL